jgi:hypothetical protein
VNIASALDVAVASLRADAIVVAPGPGVVGTGGPVAFSGLEVAGVIDTAVARGGRPIVAVRWSDADSRPRHRGVSHHVTAALAHARERATVAVPAGATSTDQFTTKHDVVEAEVADVGAILERNGLDVTTMGRSAADDPGFFRWAGAAGALAADRVK